MAVGFDNATNLGLVVDGSPSTLTVAYTVGSGANRFLLVTVFDQGGPSPSDVVSVTYNGVAATLLESAQGDRNITVWGLVAPASGTHNVVVSLGSTNVVDAIASSYDGVDQTSPVNAHVGEQQLATGSFSKSLTSTVDQCWWHLSTKDETGSAITPGGVGVSNRASGAGLTVIDSNGPLSTGAHTISAAIPSGTCSWGGIVLAIAPVSGGGGGGPVFVGTPLSVNQSVKRSAYF